jgi:hypothetical protein
MYLLLIIINYIYLREKMKKKKMFIIFMVTCLDEVIIVSFEFKACNLSIFFFVFCAKGDN